MITSIQNPCWKSGSQLSPSFSRAMSLSLWSWRLIVLPCLFLLTTHAQVLDPVFAQSHSCNATCQALANLGISWETTQHVNSSLYSTEVLITTTTKAGQLLHLEEVTDLTNYSVPSELTMSRLIYTTEDFNGTIVPASAYVLWPYSPYQTSKQNSAGSKKFNSIVWAHGTTGVFSKCAPSNYQNLQYNFMIPFSLALEGFVVIAPDYAGLGVGTFPNGDKVSHTWGLGPAQANDLAYAMQAATLGFPNALTNDFVVMGHSEGGGAAWAFAERQADRTKAVPGYLGTVALAPVTAIVKQLGAALANPLDPYLQGSLAIQGLVISSVAAAFPAYGFSAFSQVGLDRFQVLQRIGGCLPTWGLVFNDILGAISKPSWTDDDTVRRWGEISRNGGKAFKGPLLVLAGENDHVLPLNFIEEAVNNTCSLINSKKALQNESLELITFSGLDHFPVIQGSHSRWMAWIKARFEQNGGGIEAGCRRGNVEGFRVDDIRQATVPNWLISVVEPQDEWKPAL